MTPFEIGLTGLGVMIALIVARVPIAFAMILVGGGGIVLLSGPAILMSQLKTLAFSTFRNYDLSVVPLFILMGHLATHSGLSAAIFRAAHAWLGRFRGGVAMSAVAACAGFGAVSGSSLATASTMGQVALPQLRRYRYSPALATGTLAAGGVLGILIPPSVVLVVYSILVEANIVAMFAAALIPGLLAVLFFLATIAIYVRLVPGAGPAAEPVDGREFLMATLGVAPVVVIFGLVIGGIYAGLFTPTPAAAIGVFLVLVYAMARGMLTWAKLKQSILDTASTSAMIYLILLGAALLDIFMSRGGVPQAAARMIADSDLSPYVILILLLLGLIILGCLMDSLSMILLAIPFFWPVVSQLDFGLSPTELKIWFGILALIVVELGLITPPVGMNVFIISSMARDVPMLQTFKGALPFFGAELLRVALLIAFPGIVLFLPAVLR